MAFFCVIVYTYSGDNMKHIIVAGTALAGKTTLAIYLVKKGYIHYKMDSIKRAISDIYNDNSDWKEFSPKMFNIINRMIEENKTDTVYNKEYYVIDTCHLLPRDAYKLKDKAEIIFIGYTNISVQDKLKEIRDKDTPNRWTYKLDDNKLIKMIEENIEFSKYLKEECLKYNLKYYETSEIDKVKELIGE